MHRLELLIIFIALTSLLTAQGNWEFKPRIEREEYYLYDGVIDNKFPITIYLEYTWKYCGEGNSKLDPRIMRGWYEYKKYQKKIPLIGSTLSDHDYFVRLFVPESPLDTLISETCAPEDYKEVFIVEKCCTIDSMQWKTRAGNYVPVTIKETHPFSWQTKASVILTIGGINFFELDLTDVTGNQFIDTIIIESVKEVDNHFYAIISFGHLSTPGYFGSGQCGAGWENWLALIHVNQQLELEKFEFHKDQSCTKYIDKEYSFDKFYPEKGIVIKSY